MRVDDIEQMLYRWSAANAIGKFIVTNEADETLRDDIIHEIITRSLSNNPKARVTFISIRSVRIVEHKNVELLTPIDIYSKLFWNTDLLILDSYNMDKATLDTISKSFKTKWKLVIVYNGSCIRHLVSYPLINLVIPEFDYQLKGSTLHPILRSQHDEYSDSIETVMAKFDITDDEIYSIKGLRNKFQLISACNRGAGIKENGKITPYPPQYFRKQLAYLCGWNENLDVDVSIFREIDELYSPSAIGDAAESCTRIMAARKSLLVNNDDKNNLIVDLIIKNKNKSIIVYNESHRACDDINLKLRTLSVRSGIIHNYVKGVNLNDDNGHLILSGSGTPRNYGKTGVRKHYIRQYNECIIDVLLMANKQPDSITILHCDILIINGVNLNLDEILKSKLIEFSTNKEILIYFIYNESTKDYDKLKYNLSKFRVPIILKKGIIKG